MVGSTRDKIIELGRAYIQRFGYHAFNYQQIAAELQIKNAAIPYYFPSKGDLGVAALEKDLADFRQLIARMQDAAPAVKLDALLSAYESYQPATQPLCLAGVCGADYNLLPEPMQRATRQYTKASNGLNAQPCFLAARPSVAPGQCPDSQRLGHPVAHVRVVLPQRVAGKVGGQVGELIFDQHLLGEAPGQGFVDRGFRQVLHLRFAVGHGPAAFVAAGGHGLQIVPVLHAEPVFSFQTDECQR